MRRAGWSGPILTQGNATGMPEGRLRPTIDRPLSEGGSAACAKPLGAALLGVNGWVGRACAWCFIGVISPPLQSSILYAVFGLSERAHRFKAIV